MIRALVLVAVWTLPVVGHSQLPLERSGEGHVVAFAGFLGTGISPSPSGGELDATLWRVTGFSDGDSEFGGKYTAGDFARGSGPGGRSTGGLYALTLDEGTSALGVQATGSDFSPGTLTLRVTNTMNAAIEHITVTSVFHILNDQDRSTQISLEYAPDDVDYQRIGPLLVTPGARDVEPDWLAESTESQLDHLALEPGQTLFLRWHAEDAGGEGARDEFAVESVTLHPTVEDLPAPGCPDPDPCLLQVPSADGMCTSHPRPAGTRCGVEGGLCDGRGLCVIASASGDAGPIAVDAGTTTATAASTGCSVSSSPRWLDLVPLALLLALCPRRRR